MIKLLDSKDKKGTEYEDKEYDKRISNKITRLLRGVAEKETQPLDYHKVLVETLEAMVEIHSGTQVGLRVEDNGGSVNL